MCTEESLYCPKYNEISKGNISYLCEKCKLYKKVDKLMLYSKIGLVIAAILFILLTFMVY